MNETEYIVKGGIIGRRGLENDSRSDIAAQFKYYEHVNDTEKIEITESPIYILDPWTARYVGWHLLRRGIVDGIKNTFRMRGS